MATAVERFVRRIQPTDRGFDTPCWVWGAAISGTGYGAFWDGDKTVSAHRFAFRTWKGEPPRGLHLDHLCCNKECVNPDHLEPVTNRVNALRGEGGGPRGGTSRFVGVSWTNGRGWEARFRCGEGSSRNVGYFSDEVEAAKARDAAVRSLGEDRPMNFPLPGERAAC